MSVYLDIARRVLQERESTVQAALGWSETSKQAGGTVDTAGVASPPGAGEWHPDWLDLKWIERIGSDGRRTLLHPDHADDEEEVIDPPEPCHQCGTWELWQTLAGNWRCLRCDPPTVARRVREQATRLRENCRRTDSGD